MVYGNTQTLYCYCECFILSSSSSSSSSSFSAFPPFACARFFSVETSAIDLKLQQKVDCPCSSYLNIFLKIWTRVTKLDPSELKMEDATAIFQKNGAVSLQLQRRYTYIPRHVGMGATNSSSSSRPYSTQRRSTVSSRKKMQKMQNLVIDIDYLKNQDTTICGIKQSGRTKMNVIYDKV